MELVCGQWSHMQVEGEGFVQYMASVQDNKKELVIVYCSCRVEPCDEKSDPDLYVNNCGKPAEFSCYSWKSTFFGADSVRLIPGDANYLPGVYSIGIFNARKSTFRVKFDLLSMPLLVTGSFSAQISEIEYFKIQRKYPESRLEIRTSGAASAIFISYTQQRPDEHKHEFSSGFFHNTTLYTQIDPFPHLPLAYLSVHYPKEINTEFGPARACIDFSSSKATCYFSIKNLAAVPSDFQVSVSEISYCDLASESTRSLHYRFTEIFSAIDSNKVSQEDRQDLNLNYNTEFTYGEVDFFYYIRLLEWAGLENGEILWDLGSGVGKSIISAAISFPLVKVKGIEYLPKLFAICKEKSREFENIEVFQGDIKEWDWVEADVVYVSSLCFLDELVLQIFEKCQLLKIGARVLTLKEFPDGGGLMMKAVSRVKMSWGVSDCYLYVKQE